MDFNKQADVRGILSANNIPYVTKPTNLTNAQAVGSHRGHQGSLGVNQDYSYEYKIYVHLTPILLMGEMGTLEIMNRMSL